MDRIPSSVEVAVRSAGKNRLPYAGELPDIYRRARRRRTRRRAAVAFTAVAVAAGLVGGGLAVRQQRPDIQPAVAVTPTGPAQRLILTMASGAFTTAQQTDPIQLRGDLAVGELTPEGKIVPHPVSGTDDTSKAILLPDGRMVSLGPVAGREMLLSVEQPGGDLVQRDIQQDHEPVALVAATGTTAYLWRPPGLVEHDLAGGLERLVIQSMSDPPSRTLPALDGSDVVGDRLVTAESPRSCRPLLLDLRSLSALRELPVTGLGCRKVIGLRLSPSTGRVAVAYQKKGAVRVAVLSTEDGTILADRPAATADGAAGQVIVDMAWLDERNVRAVAVPSAPGAHLLKPITIAT
ncbi:hypothetical protein Aab01nite_10560 [Paractinoplanes abujensis]|uniref:Uncharacterized protein n=1 Tax=Paractinoplanes abujensis TaxID=882441 RepID=A0A7W7G0G2_9ACTN|nr:hypothetical protein [Actinoplanes abujensis]MBB4691120.1 hypothetical protein [Actinoplanes abujensis]GID17466.1 hypothetical protein Aab01nite_10560 [Actinoplanes abujensis]